VLKRFAQAIENGKIPVVPNIMLGGTGKSGSGSIVEAMLAMIMWQQQKVPQERVAALTKQYRSLRLTQALALFFERLCLKRLAIASVSFMKNNVNCESRIVT
jgi:hypothetical protein